ncbi:MAG: hypothetical protein DKM50_04770 [Candidatus Margulisiibacteriota bacterium]|nr:MAG: hypothetical protein DKM50_04770 [Candidatus Margulisiibacteriota bacterium]
MTLYLTIENKIITSTICQNLYKTELNNYIIISTQKNLDLKIDDRFFFHKCKGIVIEESKDFVLIHNDPFNSIPLYVYQDRKSNSLIVSSSIKKIVDIYSSVLTIDIVGLWEAIVLGNCINKRTIYNEILSMPSASFLNISKENVFEIERYWDYSIMEDQNIADSQSITETLYNKLDQVFNKLDKSCEYIMGLSGGLDSRITLAMLQGKIRKENLKLFTFGYDDRIYEYKYASAVAKNLNYNVPEFYYLNHKIYSEFMNEFIAQSGGSIGFQHSHIYTYLSTANIKSNSCFISNYYSDATFGYSAKYQKKIDDTLENSDIYNKIIKLSIESSIRNGILNDLNEIAKMYSIEFNYSSFDEYFYVTERNPKFHMVLSEIYRYFLPVECPYADFELLTLMISIPLKFRHDKIMVDQILLKYFDQGLSNIGDVSSRNWNGVDMGVFKNYRFHMLNRINSVLRVITRGYIQIFNPFQTEVFERIFFLNFKKDFFGAINLFANLKIIDKNLKKWYFKTPLRSGQGISERYQILSLYFYLKDTIKHGFIKHMHT